MFKLIAKCQLDLNPSLPTMGGEAVEPDPEST